MSEHSTKPPKTRATSSNKRHLQAQARREQLLSSALTLFARYGYDATTTKQIAQASDVAEGLLFHYFPDKLSILLALLEQRNFGRHVQELLLSSPMLPLSEMMTRIGQDWVALNPRGRQMMRIALEILQRSALFEQARERTLNLAIEHCATYLKTRIQAGEMRADLNPQLCAFQFFAPLFLFELIHGDLKPKAWQQQAATFANTHLSIWLAGVAAQHGGQQARA